MKLVFLCFISCVLLGALTGKHFLIETEAEQLGEETGNFELVKETRDKKLGEDTEGMPRRKENKMENEG